MGGASTTHVKPSAEKTYKRQPSSWLCCRVCSNRIVLSTARVSFDAGHTHRFINPHGFEFRIGLFDDAPGCRHEGESTEYFSWFPGYTWRIALCAACRARLGWVFECIGRPGPGEPEGFYGLVVERLQAR